MSSDNVIDHFMKEWKQKKPYYEILAKSAWEMCKEALEKEGIKAEAKWRVKDNEQLRAKCVTRSQTKPYANPEEIFEDIADLAGVRLALYFPNQITNVAHMIDRTFQVEKVKKHKGQEPGEQEDPNDRFSRGYFAEHFRVTFKKPQENNEEMIGMVEIQVMSVLHQSWAEARHNITYKAMSGNVTKKEHDILGGLNGLLFTGDLLLELFHDTYVARITQKNDPFANHFELGTYLSKQYSKTIQDQNGAKLGRVKVLYELLENLNQATGVSEERPFLHLNTPRGLEFRIKQLQLETGPEPSLSSLAKSFDCCEMTISVHLMHHVLHEARALPSASVNDEDSRRKLEIVLSSILWLGELFPETHAVDDILCQNAGDLEYGLLIWICRHPSSRGIFVKEDTSLTAQTHAYIGKTWDFFQQAMRTNKGGAAIAFVFTLSHHVPWKFPRDLARINKLNLPFEGEIPYPY